MLLKCAGFKRAVFSLAVERSLVFRGGDQLGRKFPADDRERSPFAIRTALVFGAEQAVESARGGQRPQVRSAFGPDHAVLEAGDVGRLRELGWELVSVAGLDLFPMTQHVEAVAVLRPAHGLH